MTFPDTPLDIRAELDLSGTWTAVTSYVQRRGSLIQVRRGRSDEAASLERSTVMLALNNRDGRFSPRNPLGAYYGGLGRNTPLRISLPYGSTYLGMSGTDGEGATCPDAAALGITGDIDIRADMSLMSWRHGQNLCGKYETTGNQRSWAVQLSGDGYLSLTWSTDGTSGALSDVTSTVPVSVPADHRQAVRVTLDVDNGAGGHTVTFYTADTISGLWVQLGDQVAGSGTTSVFDSTAGLEVGDVADLTVLPDLATTAYPVTGKIHAFQLLDGIGGTVVANPDFTIQTAGAVSFADTASTPNTWTVAGAASLDDRDYRAYAEVSELPQRWDVSGSDVYTPIVASGVLRRLTQGASDLGSPMYRGITTLAANQPVAYWSCEDSSGASQLASGLSGGSAMTVSGSASLASSSVFVASDPLPTVGSSTWSGDVPVYSPSTNVVRFLLNIPSGGTTNNAVICRVFLRTGAISYFDLIYTTAASGTLIVTAYDITDTALASSGNLGGFNGRLARLSMTSTQSGGNISFGFEYVAVGDTSVTGSSTGSVAETLSRVTRVQIGPKGTAGDVTIGHISVHASDSWTDATLFDEITGYAGETAGRRIQRLCAEEGIAFRWAGSLDDTQAMSAQQSGTLLSLLTEAATTDGGVLFEPRDVLGMGYRPRTSLYNQGAAFELDYSSGELFGSLDPTDDDRYVRNDVTVTRRGGSSARAELTTGALSTQAPPDGVGRYREQVTVATETDGVLADHASWRVHLGTVDEERYPNVTVDLSSPRIAADSALVAAVQRADIGDRFIISNPPAWMPPGEVEQLVEGSTEILGNFEHSISLNCSPASPWNIGTADDALFARADTAGSELASGITSTATSISVATTSGPVWTTDHEESPWDLRIGGEVITVSAVGTVLNDNPFFASDASGWIANNGTIARSTAVVHSGYGAVASLLITPNGVSASGGANADPHTAAGTITPGASYTAVAWAYSPGGWSDLRTAVDWYDASDVFLSSSLGSGTSVTAGAWTFLEQTFTAPASASRASVRARHGGTPTAGDIWYAWGIRLIPDASVSSTSPQTMTVIRSVNGIVKAHSSGADARLATPMILGL